MIKNEIRNTERGRMLFLTDGKTEVGCALDFGIRISHLSVAGMENIFYEQPADCSDGIGSADGWRVYGGHRLWNTPEEDTNYYPDNDPIDYELTDDGVILKQKPDPLRLVEKAIIIRFLEDGRVQLTNIIKNIAEEAIDTAAWGVNTLSGGDVDVDFCKAEVKSGGYPDRNIAMWGATSLMDERVTWTAEHLSTKFKPLKDYFKIGLYTSSAKAAYVNAEKGQKFTLEFGADDFGKYPDGNANCELWLNTYCVEMESLGIVKHLEKGDSVEHTEFWRVEKV